jgi:hypothetical protein
MTSIRKIEANRRNARRSTGPRTQAGKARSAQNARRHGLNVAAARDPAFAGVIAGLARLIAGPDAAAIGLALACAVAAAQVDVMRARRARCALWPSDPGEAGAVRRLACLYRYEQRALALRDRAIDAFDAAMSALGETKPAAAISAVGETKPTRESAALAAGCADARRRPPARRSQAIDALEADLAAVGETKPTQESAESPAGCAAAGRSLPHRSPRASGAGPAGGEQARRRRLGHAGGFREDARQRLAVPRRKRTCSRVRRDGRRARRLSLPPWSQAMPIPMARRRAASPQARSPPQWSSGPPSFSRWSLAHAAAGRARAVEARRRL